MSNLHQQYGLLDIKVKQVTGINMQATRDAIWNAAVLQQQDHADLEINKWDIAVKVVQASIKVQERLCDLSYENVIKPQVVVPLVMTPGGYRSKKFNECIKNLVLEESVQRQFSINTSVWLTRFRAKLVKIVNFDRKFNNGGYWVRG